VEREWKRIVFWLKANAPEQLEGLRQGASAAAVATLENGVSQVLPDDYKELLRLHDGEDTTYGLLGGWYLLGAGEALQHWEALGGLERSGAFEGPHGDFVIEGPVRAMWRSPAWIPIVSDQAGNFHMLDLDPAPGGSPGQVIYYSHDDAHRAVLATSTADYLRKFADKLEAGQFEVRRAPSSRRYMGLRDVKGSDDV